MGQEGGGWQKGQSEAEWDMVRIGWVEGRHSGQGSGANPEMEIGRKCKFWGDTEASVGPGGYKGPRGYPGGGVQDTVEPQV